MSRGGHYPRGESEFDRAITFFDATFAVALTFLITGLDLHNRASSFTSVSALAEAVGAQFISFLIAFAVTAGYWLMHHRMVASFVAIDTPNIVVNLCVLAAIILLPFSTSSVGDPGTAELPLPTALMAINVAVVSILYTVVWAMASRRRLLDHRPSWREWRAEIAVGLAPAVVFLVSIPLAYLVSPGIARLSWLALLVVNPAVGKLATRNRQASENR